MIRPWSNPGRRPAPAPRARGSVLIIVLWIAFGLVSLAVYFGHAMLMAYRAGDQNTAGVAAEQAIDGAVRYLSFVLTNAVDLGQKPPLDSYEYEAVPVGEAFFWVVGRATLNSATDQDLPCFGLVDEASKLNLNTATLEMLEALPGMTPELAAAIIDWRDADSEPSANGAESETYQRLNPAYTCKNANFETLEELRLVAGADEEILWGEDTNGNGLLDDHENDGDRTPPADNRDGRLDAGLVEYLTVYSRESNLGTNGSPRINVSGSSQQELQTRLQELFGQDRANAISFSLSTAGGNFRSLLEFYLRSGMTAQEFEQIENELSVTNATYVDGLINVNTASATVLACVPGLGTEKADQLVAYRSNQAEEPTSLAWVKEVLDEATIVQAGPYLTAHSYQFSADIVALGPEGRGYRRALVILDTSEGTPKVIYRRDRSRLGWALGAESPQVLLARKERP